MIEGETIESFPPPGRKRKEAFIDRLVEYNWDTRETIIGAYDMAETAHRGQFRSSGEPYFTHPVASTVILIDECGIRDPNILIGSLLHDTVEDSIMFGDIGKLTSSEWIHIARFRLRKYFNPEVEEIVTSLTKPKIDGTEVKTEEQRRTIAMEQLRNASPEALLVKMADRVHNLRTLRGMNNTWKEGLVVDETQNLMFEIFKRAAEKYPNEHKILETAISDAICDYENGESRWLFFYNHFNGPRQQNNS